MFGRIPGLLVDLSFLGGTLTLLSGGIRARHQPFLGDVDLRYYGPFFLPLALCLVFDLHPTGSRAIPFVKRWAARFDALPARTQRLWAIGTLAACLLTHALCVFLRYFSFQTAMDLAIYANACRGALYSTMKGDVWLFADHFEPLLLLFTPLCRTFSPSLSLLAVQTLGWGIGTWGIYLLALRQQFRPSLAWLCAMLYLNFSGNVTIAYYDFHLLSLTLGLVPWLWWAIATEHWGWVVALGVTYLGLKESAALSIVGLGAFLWLTSLTGRAHASQDRRHGRRATGIAFIALGTLTFVLIMKVVYPAFRDGEGTMYFAKYYGHLGRDLPEFLHTALTRPLYFLSHLLTPTKLFYLALLFLPFLFFALRKPIYLLPVLPAILVNVLSNNHNLYSLGYHYEAEIFPALFAMAVIALNDARARALWLAVLLVAFTSKSALGVARWNVPTPAQRNLEKLLAEHVPYDRAIAAPQRIAAHLTDRPKLYMFDYWQMEDDWKRADLVVVGFDHLKLGWYSWDILQDIKLPLMRPYLKVVYADRADPRFRVFEVLPSAKYAPTIAAPGATAEDSGNGEPQASMTF